MGEGPRKEPPENGKVRKEGGVGDYYVGVWGSALLGTFQGTT